MKWLAGEYLRLSKEKRGQMAVSDSIENQKLVIRRFFDANPDVTVVDTYIDDGATGLDYDRQGFERMNADLESGRINMIVTKDLSRLGREQIQTLQLVTLAYVEKQIRYVAVEDNYDSFINPDTTMIEMKAFWNNFYSADNSRKVRAVQRAKREKGEFIGSFAPYGYLKDPDNKNRLIIDEEAASIVQQIFELYLMGNGIQTIARHLNQEKILPPTAYKQFKQNLTYKNGLKYETTTYWTYSSVRRILSHEVYVGNMVQHTIEKITYKSKRMRAIPKAHQCIVEGTHEPIIDREKFDMVQDMIRIRSRDLGLNQNVTIFAGLFFCGDCKRRMCKFLNGNNKNGKRTVTYKCASYSQYGKEICTIHSIKETELTDIVLTAIKDNAIKALEEKDFKRIQSSALSRKRNSNEKIRDKLQHEIRLRETRHNRMLMNLSDDIISRQEFIAFSEQNRKEQRELEEKLAGIEEKILDEKAYLQQHTQWVDHFIQYKDITQLRREILVNLVQRIEIYEDKQTREKRIELTFRFRNPFEEM